MVEKDIECLDKIKRFTKEVSKQFKIEGVYLFGSHARKENFKDSDIDLVIISSDFERLSPLDRLVKLGILAWRANTPEIEAIGYTPPEFNEAQAWEFPSAIREDAIAI